MKLRDYPIAKITKKAEKMLKAGHTWVFAEEITEIDDSLENGCLVDVVSQSGSYMGTGILSLCSKIRIRILSTNANDKYDRAFFARRIRYALDYRKTVMGDDINACRLVFGEADGLPGLTVDRYENILSIQTLSYGMEMRKDMIFEELVSALQKDGVDVCGIFERNEAQIRTLEGLEMTSGWYEKLPHTNDTKVIITENGVKYNVDVENGQKTGFFLDQKYNRLAAAKIAKGKNVLDMFTHTGSFALNCALGGAAHVTAVDVSQTAIDQARENAVLNGLENKMDFLCCDVFDLLPKLCEEKHAYDFVILDPPAFTKSRATIKDARRGYKEINYRAMKLLPRGGYFATCSCSHFMGREMFEEMLADAARDANVSLKLIEARRQSPDHPVVFGIPDSDYLKFYLFQII